VRLGITGAGGFIGRRLAVRAEEEGHTLVLVDRVPHPRLPTITADYWDAEPLRALAGCEVVLHLAAISGIVACDQNPALARRVNIEGLCHLAEALEAQGRPMVFASSFSVVGEPRVQPIPEETPYAPLNEYARQKVAGEMVTRSLGARGIVVRMSNIYGSYELDGTVHRKGNVITLFAQQARSGRLRLHAPGTQARDFLHVEDAVEIWLAAARYAPTAREGATILHAASGEMWSVRELADEVQRLLPERVSEELVANPRVESVVPEFAVAVERTQKLLGVRPKHRVKDVLRAELAPAGSA
jgi:UDP-glucose 4-epimerase